MAFPERFLDELTERNDIVDVVSQYVRLTKKSGANLFGLCPFHSEKTPSFSVAPDKQIYHCFGCGQGDRKSLVPGCRGVSGAAREHASAGGSAERGYVPPGAAIGAQPGRGAVFP